MLNSIMWGAWVDMRVNLFLLELISICSNKAIRISRQFGLQTKAFYESTEGQ